MYLAMCLCRYRQTGKDTARRQSGEYEDCRSKPHGCNPPHLEISHTTMVGEDAANSGTSDARTKHRMASVIVRDLTSFLSACDWRDDSLHRQNGHPKRFGCVTYGIARSLTCQCG